MSEEELIAAHVAKKGVTRCPTVAVAATTATISCGPLPDEPETRAKTIMRAAALSRGNRSIKQLQAHHEAQRKRSATFAARRAP